MRAQVVQSPEQMKAEKSRMHSTLALRKETKKEKGHRVQELRDQNENCELLLHSSDQGDAMITAINTELEKQRISIHLRPYKSLNKKDTVSKMQAQVVQSPERMKADISRMHSTLASRKETRKEKGHRVHELRGQNENCQLLLQSSDQGDAMITGINAELEKQRTSVSCQA
ncbi:uncharacterized protein LOC135155838 [Lytechinus pictus]|uniref:uncharacterized protein LOC135155838 n=1 Tax=Lytechinus pictus TaxID=7653 RepID=UPI0030B9EF52